MYHHASWKVEVRISLRGFTQLVPGAAHRMDEGRVEVLVDLASQTADVHIDDVGLRVEVIVPDVLEQHRPGDDLVAVAHQVFEQAEFARLQVDLLAGAADRARNDVNFKIADDIARRHGRRRLMPAAPQRLDAREKLGEGVGLYEIIVAARLEAFDAIVNFAERGQEKRRRFVAAGAPL